jgi:flagellar basal body P-ring protein FlgI
MDRTVLKHMLYRPLLAVCVIVGLAAPSFAAARIKDIGHFSGVRSNPLIGYGLVIGLNKTGDKRQTFFTQQTLLNMLERFGITVNNPAIRVENIAAVMVTARLNGPALESMSRFRQSATRQVCKEASSFKLH